jgi:hypothetical protein
MPPIASRVASRFLARSASVDPREAAVVDKIKRVIARITGYGVAASKQVTRDNAVMLDARRNQVIVRGANKLWAIIESDVIVDSESEGDLLADKAANALTRYFKVQFTVSQDLWHDYTGSYGFNVNIHDLLNAGGGSGGITIPASSWVTSLADFVGKTRIQRRTLDRGELLTPYQTSNTTVEQASVDIRPWLQGHGMSERAFADALSRVDAKQMFPVGEHMGLREVRGAPIVKSKAAYTIEGGNLVLTYRETIYYN